MPFLVRNWAPALAGLILITPLFGLPRPTNVSSIPWRVELLFSVFLVAMSVAAYRSNELGNSLRNALDRTQVKTIVFLIAVFCVWSAISSIWGKSPTAAVHHTLLWANYAVIFVFAYAVASMRNGKAAIVQTLASPTILIGILATFDFLTIQDFATQEGTLRIRYAKFAEMLAVIAPVLLSAALVARSRRNFALAALIGSFAWIGVMLSLSKGAFLAGSVGIVVFLILTGVFRHGPLRKVAAVSAVWIVLTAGFQFGISALTSVPSTVNYISGSADATRSTSDMRVFTWKVAGEMIRSDPFKGVGADNFGLAFNAARASLAQNHPQDPDAGIGEYYVFERAHNEPVQIFAELGIVGIAIFGAIVAACGSFFASAINRKRTRMSPMFFGSIGGMAAFAASSLVSSFSVRAYQNGIVFFIVLGFAFALARTSSEKSSNERVLPAYLLKPLFAAAAVMLLAFSTLKATSQYVLFCGERSRDLESAVARFSLAAVLDPDNPGAQLAAAEASARGEQWADAVPHFRRAIERGFGVSLIYSYLANAQEKSGDMISAESTLIDSVSIFPRSAFLRVRLAVVQEQLGRPDAAAEQLSIARSFDERQTNGWYTVIKYGILNAHLKATADPKQFAAPPELLPENAIHQYNTDKVQVHSR